MTGLHPRSPIPFAHRGGRAHFRDNTLDGFRNALAKGIVGLETDAWLTADGEVVLDHDGVVRSWVRPFGRPIGQIERAELPDHIPALRDVFAMSTPGTQVCIDVKIDSVAGGVVEIAREFGAIDRLWLGHAGYNESDPAVIARWREVDPALHLVDSTTVRRFHMAPREYAKRTADAGIDVVNLKGKAWTPALMDTFHSAGVQCFAFDVQSTRRMRELLAMGADGIFSDHVDRLIDAFELGRS